MTVNSKPKYPVAPLQRVVAEAITDPAEQQALDEFRRRLRDRVVHTPSPESMEAPQPALVTRVVDLCSQLPETARGTLLVRLQSELSAEQQFHLLADVVAQLPASTLQSLETEFSARLRQDPR
jgi:hypothetical protein